MRARAAYISSLGTTGILVIAALLMLGVVSALVAFHGWPNSAVGETVPSVTPKPTGRLALTAYRKAPVVKVVSAGRTIGTRNATVGLVKQVPARTPESVGVGTPISLQPGYTPTSPPAASPPPQPPQGVPARDPGTPGTPETPAPPAPPDLTQPPGMPIAPPQELAAVVASLLGRLPLP